MLLTVPPWLNSDTIRTSPSWWLPVNAVVEPLEEQSTVPSPRNQNPTFPVPVFAFRSRPKYMMSSSSVRMAGVLLSSVNDTAYAFITSVLLLTLLSWLHCHPGVIGSVSLLPVANVDGSAVLKLPFAFVAKSLSKPEVLKPGLFTASGRTGDGWPLELKK